MDGSGYPHKMPGEKIPQLVRMVAIVDVYDAITSDRQPLRACRPGRAAQAVGVEQFHFDPKLVQLFMRTVGIYPVGSLVRLELAGWPS